MCWNTTNAQDILKKVSPIGKDLIDTLFIDNNVNNWSVRGFGSFKDYTFKLINGPNKIKYVPKNRFGLGVGYANSKIHLDMGFNIKGQEAEVTERFTLSADLTLGKSFFGFRVTRYQGYDVQLQNAPDLFRDDIKTFGVDLFYTMLFNSKQVSLSSVLSGSQKQIKNAGSFIGGLFAYYHTLEADSSIITPTAFNEFNTESQYEKVNSLAFGVSGGYAYNIVFAKHFFVSLAAYPGIGLNFKKVEIENESYRPDDYLIFLLGVRASIGYNGPRYYLELSDKHSINSSGFNFGNRGILNSSQIKLAFGWKLRAKLD